MRKKIFKSNLILPAVEILILLALLIGCFRRDELIYTFFGEDISGMVTDAGGHGEFCGDSMELTPGVYQVRIKTSLSDGQSMYVRMNYERAYFNSMRSNGMDIFSNHDYADFKVYVLDKVPLAYVQCDFYGVGAEGLVQLEVWRTGIGSRMLLFIALVCFGALNLMLEFRRRILDGRVTGKQQVAVWTLAAGVLLAYFPYLTDYFTLGADSVFHWGRIAYLADALQQGGQFPVRLEGTWLYGHGYASSMFYSDFFLFIPACLCLIGFSIMDAYKVYLFLILAATAVIAYFSFKRCVRDEYAALFGSMIYLLTPYHLLNVYNRGALGEYSAMAFLPLVCCGMYLLYTEDVTRKGYTKYKWFVIWGMTAILQCHLITTEMTAALMALLCVVLWRKTFRKQTFCQLLEAAGIVLLINAWFWLPMLYMMNADTYRLETVISEAMQERGSSLAGMLQLLPKMGGAQTGMWNGEPIQAGAAGIMLLLLYVLWQREDRRRDYTCRILASFSILLLVMSTRYVPWEAIKEIPGIGYIASSLQFPTRWLSPATALVSMLAAFFFLRVREEGGIWMKTAVGVVAALTLVSAVYQVNDVALESNPIWLYNKENMGTISVVNGEYLLAEVNDADFYYHKPVADDGLIWSEYEKNGTNVTLSLDNRTEEVRNIEIPLTGYKGYGIRSSDGEGGTPFITEARGAHGDLKIEVPAGYRGTVKIYYKGFALFRMAEVISLLGLTVMVGVYVCRRVRKIRLSAERKGEETAE